MAYATIDDMIQRFSAAEMIRLTTPQDREMDMVVASVAEAALDDASAAMDGYIGRRYRVPMMLPPKAVTAMCANIARYNLSTGDNKTCSEEVRNRYTDAVKWLKDVSAGLIVLELDEVAAGDESYAEVHIGREAAFGGGGW